MCGEKKYKVVLFDLDGTLTDSAKGIFNCIKYALNELGVQEYEEETLKKFLGPPLDYSFMEFGHMDYDTAWEAVHKYRERYNTIGKYENKAFDGMERVLAVLKEKGVLVGLATSKPEPQALDIMEKYGLSGYFDKMTGSDYEGTRHDKHQVILEALRRLGIPEEEYGFVIMIGDRKYDIEGAKQAGIDSLGVGYGYAPEGELKSSGADYLVDTMGDLEQWVKAHT